MIGVSEKGIINSDLAEKRRIIITAPLEEELVLNITVMIAVLSKSPSTRATGVLALFLILFCR